jgi:hypothetical protein
MSIAASDEILVNLPANSFFKSNLENGNVLYFIFDRNQGAVYSQECDSLGTEVGERAELLDGFSNLDATIGGQQLSDGTYLLSFSEISNAGKRLHFKNTQYHLDSDGTLLGTSTSVDDTVGSSPRSLSIGLSNGGHVEITRYQQYGGGTIALQSVFDADGSLVVGGASLFTDGLLADASARAAALDDGRYVVSWKQHQGKTHADGMYVQVFNGDGSPNSNPTYIDSEVYDGYTPDRITVLADGKFVISAHHGDDTGVDVSEHIFNTDGTLFKTIDNLHFNNASQLNPTVAALGDGGFVAAWMEGYGNYETSGDIYLQRFDGNGDTIGNVTWIADPIAYASDLRVLALQDDGWVVFWADHRNDGRGVFQQVFDSDGAAIGTAARVTNEAGVTGISRLIALDDGGWTVTLKNGVSRTFHVDTDNHAPLIFDTTVTVNEDTALWRYSWAKFGTYDSDGDAISAFQITDVQVTGALTLDGKDVEIGDMIKYRDMRHLKYAPPADANGDALASFSGKAVDSHGAISTEAAQFSIDVAPVPDAPVSAGFHRTIYENGSYHFQQSDFAFSDVDGDLPETIYVTGLYNHGELLRNGKATHGTTAHIKYENIEEYEWRPYEGYSHTGMTALKFAMIDTGHVQHSVGRNLSPYYRFEIDILPINHAPSSKSLNLHVLEDTSFAFSPDRLLFKDRDGDSLRSIVIDSLPTGGELKLGSRLVHAGQEISATDLSKLSWTPDENEFGANLGSFTFRARDDGGVENGGLDTSESVYTITFSVKDTAETIIGTEDDDKLLGTNGKDIIKGLGGDDVLNGGQGDNILIGGKGRDVFSAFHGAYDLVKDFDSFGRDHDKIDMRSSQSYESFSDLQGSIWQVGNTVAISGSGENGYGLLEIRNITVGDLTEDCFLF